MFATAAHSPMNQRQAGAYKQMQVTTSVSDASPHALVGMLYDGWFDTVAQARGAMRAGSIEAKGRAISHAVTIVNEGLRDGLNMQDGGKLAANLDGLYGYIAVRLVEANFRNDEAALDECCGLMGQLRDAWKQIASQTVAAAS